MPRLKMKKQKTIASKTLFSQFLIYLFDNFICISPIKVSPHSGINLKKSLILNKKRNINYFFGIKFLMMSLVELHFKIIGFLEGNYRNSIRRKILFSLSGRFQTKISWRLQPFYFLSLPLDNDNSKIKSGLGNKNMKIYLGYVINSLFFSYFSFLLTFLFYKSLKVVEIIKQTFIMKTITWTN